MFALGLAGGLDAIHEQVLDDPRNYTYDGAAVLLRDGVVVAAMEEERLDRIKHSNKFPVRAIQFCLGTQRLRIGDLDSIAYYVDEPTADALLTQMYLARPEFQKRLDARSLMRAVLGRELGCDIDPSRIEFYEHKLTHAACAMHQSGFDAALVYVIDNAGGLYAGQRDRSSAVSMQTIALTKPAESLQKLCHALLPFFGLGLFEEYKALALATYGNPKPFERSLDALYELLPDGQYRLRLDRVAGLLAEIEPPRAGAELSSWHRDLAAALQAAMERIVLHVLAHHRATTGLRRLCMAGGMAENSWTNSAVLYAGLFDDVFVHPAAYDSGCALGAALLASQNGGRPAPRARLCDVSWGSDIGGPSAVSAELNRWSGFVEVEPSNDVAAVAAKLIAGGALVGWVQGRSHFGTHALGSRNVLADPRIAPNRERLHRALGRTETYRPLTVMIREDDLALWCDLPPGIATLAFQTFAVLIRPDRRAELEAALHPDGRARVQTISEATEPLLWRLIGELGQLTGCAAVLSASLNRSVEPTAESIDDAVACFVRSGLDYLIVGDRIARKVASSWDSLLTLRIALPPYVQLVRRKGWTERQRGTASDELRATFAGGPANPITQNLGDALADLDAEMPLRQLVAAAGLDPDGERRLVGEITELWSAGMVVLRPDQAPGAAP
jgi:carbamoyltransferase